MSSFEVYKAITAVTSELAKQGISKDKKNQQQGFQYRGIDDCYNALAHELAAAKLCILPRMVSKKEAERTSAKGGTLFYTAVDAEFDFVSAIDGSKHTVGPIYGEAFDSGDKSIGKAMSYAYKAMAFMTFAIPTEGDNDPDANCHEVKPQKQQPAKSAAQGQTGTTGTHAQGGEKKATEGQVKLLNGKITKSGITRDDFKAKYALAHVEDLPMSKVNDAIKWLDEAITAAAS